MERVTKTIEERLLGLEQQVRDLEEELANQWEVNHSEHCGHFPALHEGDCHWPMPKLLERLEGRFKS